MFKDNGHLYKPKTVNARKTITTSQKTAASKG